MAKQSQSKQAPLIMNHSLNEPSLLRKWFAAIMTLFVLSFFAMTAAGMLYVIIFGEKASFGNVAHIKVQGTIMSQESSGLFATPVASSDEIVKFLQDAQKDDNIKAVLLEINSPGGSAVASSEIADQIKKVREKKPVVSVIREVGASGGYWIASATERIFANPLSSTGSIGVISSYVEYAGIMDRYNLTYQRLVFGKYKDSGSPYKRLTEEERGLAQDKLRVVGDAFIDVVATNRNLPREKVEEVATGLVFLGTEAKKLGLIDEFGGRQDAISYLEKKLNITVTLAEYQKVPSLFSALSGVASGAPSFGLRQVPSQLANPLADQSMYEPLTIQALAQGEQGYFAR